MPELDGAAINQQNLLLAIGRLEGKLDLLISRLELHVADDKEAFAAQDARIKALENSKSFIWGVAAAIGALCGGLAAKIAAIL